MRRRKPVVLPSVDVMEPRLLLSTAAPVVSKHALNGIVREAKAIVSTLAKTQDEVQASARLTALSSRVPSGATGLALSWQSDLGLYRPHSARSINTTKSRIVGDLYRFIQSNGGNQTAPGSVPTSPTSRDGTGGIAAPLPTPTTGHGTVGVPAPVATTSLDSVRIENTTGMALLVTVHLNVPGNQQPWITETIPAQGGSIVAFDFGSATNAFMTMDVKRADGGQSPTPFDNINLSQPTSGYNGVVFSVSLFGPYFNVSVT